MADLMSGSGRCDDDQACGARKMPDEYDHDQISIRDLMELGVTVAAFGRGDVELPAAEDRPGVPGDGLTLPYETESVSATAGSAGEVRSEEHTSELQSLMRISYAGFC